MSARGQTLPKWAVRTMSGLPPLATELRTSLVVRLVPDSEMPAAKEPDTYSITALALATSPAGISMPSAFAVLRLITSSKRAS